MRVRSAWGRAAVVGMFGVLGMIVAACGSTTPSVEAMDLVPPRSNAIGMVDLAQVLSDADVRTAYEMIAAANADTPATFEELLTLAEDEIGVPLDGFHEVIFFSEVDDADSGYGGVLASGSPPQADVFAAIIAARGSEVQTSEYGGQSVLVAVDGDVIAVLGEVLVLGSATAVHDVIDVFNGVVSPLGGEILGLYDELGDVWAKAVVDVPDGTANDLGDLGLPVDLGGLLDVQWVGVVADKDGADFLLTVRLEYSTVGEATESAETLQALLTLVTSFSDDADLQTLADALSVSSTGRRVELEIRQNVQESLDALQGLLESGGSGIPSVSF